MKKVYVVEHRRYSALGTMEIVIAFLAKTKRAALRFIKKNRDYDGDRADWWWAVYAMPLDADPVEIGWDEGIAFYDPEGRGLEEQP